MELNLWFIARWNTSKIFFPFLLQIFTAQISNSLDDVGALKGDAENTMSERTNSRMN